MVGCVGCGARGERVEQRCRRCGAALDAGRCPRCFERARLEHLTGQAGALARVLAGWSRVLADWAERWWGEMRGDGER